jgi:hypothetical protein
VDKAWHALILHTRAYARLCQQLRGPGGFIHHEPNDVAIAHVDTAAVPRTVKLMRAAGYRPDRRLWPPSAKCSHSCGQCDEGVRGGDDERRWTPILSLVTTGGSGDMPIS